MAEVELDSVIGQFGRYQFFLFLAGSISEIPIGMHSIFTVFGAATPDYRCASCLDGVSNEFFNHTANEPNIENTFFEAEEDSCGEARIDRCYRHRVRINVYSSRFRIMYEYTLYMKTAQKINIQHTP